MVLIAKRCINCGQIEADLTEFNDMLLQTIFLLAAAAPCVLIEKGEWHWFSFSFFERCHTVIICMSADVLPKYVYL